MFLRLGIWYSDLNSSVYTWKLERNIGRQAKKRDKNNKKNKRFLLKWEIRAYRINYFTRKKNERWSYRNFPNNGISNYGSHFLNISLQTGNLLSRQISKSKSINQFDFFANRVIYFWNELINQIENSNSIKNLRLNWIVSEKVVRKRI